MRLLTAIIALFYSFQSHAGLPHLDLEMTGAEYERTFGAMRPMAFGDLDPAMNLGKRNLDWLRFINENRAPEHRLSFSSKETQKGYPIDQPVESNDEIIMERYASVTQELPEEMKEVLLNGKPFHADLGLSDEEYLKFGLAVDRVYQSASRWILQQPYLWAYKRYKKRDIRGYYFLSKEKDLSEKLGDWSSLDDATKERLKPLLLGLCFNRASSTERSCERELNSRITTGTVAAFYGKYYNEGKSAYDGFFELQNARGDVDWSVKDPDQMRIPFVNPGNRELRDFLSVNIEDEWRFVNWNLKLDFVPDGSGNPYVVFEPGATPHVDGLGGDRITMDANQPLSEYNVQWTIRHEFGHVLGLPDCYVEFYDEARSVMVSYQIDVTNLMCSRQGHIQQLHVDELKRKYFR